MDENYKTVRTIPFDGKKASWHMWSRLFLSKLTVQVHINATNGRLTVLYDSEVVIKTLANSITDEETKARDTNSEMYSELIISFLDETSFSIIDNSKTNKLENGSALEAWLALKEKFEPATHAAKCIIQQEFQNMKLKSGQYPDPYITNLEKLKFQLVNTHKSKMNNDDLITQVINGLP